MARAVARKSGMATILNSMRQQPLLDEQDGVFPGVEGDGAIMPGASVDGNIHRRDAPRTKIFLARLDLHLADFGQDFFVAGMFAQVVKIRVL